jgi:hypothetical protein
MKFIILIFSLIFAISFQAFSAIEVGLVQERCTQNSLTIEQAHGRNRWAEKCKEYFLDDKPQFLEVFYALKNLPRPFYALVSTEDEQRWDAPTNKNEPCEPYTKYFTMCLASCFTPTQEILFEDGYTPIKEALNQKKQGLMTLTKDSRLEKFYFQSLEVDAYMANKQDAWENIIKIQTESGGSLEVTLDHPILLSSGIMIKANHLKIGQKLLRDNGYSDPIVSLTRKKYFGKVYNIAPQSVDKRENIIAAQGFLVGSANYQYHELFQNIFYRQVLRSQIKL